MKRELIVLSVFLFIIIYCANVFAALGLSPAIKNIDFSPNLKFEYTYTVEEDDSEKEIEIYAGGELAEYVSFDKTMLVGGGSFKVTVELPEEIKVPGKHRILIGVKEVPGDEESLIGTSLTVEAVIYVFVPYPGKYLEASISTSGDVNAGENVKFISNVNNLGKEDVVAGIGIDVYSASGEKIETLGLGDKDIKSQERKTYNTILKTEDYKPGPYRAELVVNYGEILRAETSFRIGGLFVNITNYTRELLSNKINKFSVGIESQWNSKLENIYAEVKVRDINLSFKTVSSELMPWERKSLEGYIDVGDFEGVYDAVISLNYAGIISEKEIEIKIVKETNLTLHVLLGVLVFAVVLVYFFLINRRKNDTKKK